MKSIPTLTHSDALHLLDVIRQELDRQKAGAAVAIVDPHGELIAFLRTDGCPLPSINNAINKAFTAAREGKASKDVGRAAQTAPFPMTNFGDLRYTGWGGGMPFISKGNAVGAVGVSGLPEAEDIELARICVNYFEEQILTEKKTPLKP